MLTKSAVVYTTVTVQLFSFMVTLRISGLTVFLVTAVLLWTGCINTNQPSVLWRCWLGSRKGIRPVKNWVVECWLERGADLHMAQLMPLPLTVSCFSKIQIGFTFLVPARLEIPEKGLLNGCVCVVVLMQSNELLPLLLHQFNGLFTRTTWISRYQKGKTCLDLNEARDDGVLGYSHISWTIRIQIKQRQTNDNWQSYFKETMTVTHSVQRTIQRVDTKFWISRNTLQTFISLNYNAHNTS